MSTFQINTNGRFSLKEKSREFYKMLIGGMIFYSALFSAIKFTIDNKGYSLFLMAFLTMLYLFIFIFIPISLKIRINKVINSIKFGDLKIVFTTNKSFIYCKNDITVQEVKNRFTGFGLRDKSGILIRTKEGKEFWIVEDFYNDYEDLKLKLIALKTDDNCK